MCFLLEPHQNIVHIVPCTMGFWILHATELLPHDNPVRLRRDFTLPIVVYIGMSLPLENRGICLNRCCRQSPISHKYNKSPAVYQYLCTLWRSFCILASAHKASAVTIKLARVGCCSSMVKAVTAASSALLQAVLYAKSAACLKPHLSHYPSLKPNSSMQPSVI